MNDDICHCPQCDMTEEELIREDVVELDPKGWSKHEGNQLEEDIIIKE